MHWLKCDGRRVAQVEIADTFLSRTRGLLGRSDIQGAMYLVPARSVHTFGMRFPIDVAYCDDSLTVIERCTLHPNRVGKRVRNTSSIVEAAEGAFDGWGLHLGSYLEISE